MWTECASGLTHTLMHLTEITVLFAKLLVMFCRMLRCIALISLLSLAFSLIPLMFKGTLHSVKKNPYTEGLLCLLLHSEGAAIFLCRLTV